MNETDKKVIDAINESPYKAYFAITGGGQTFIGDYMSRSGASNTVIGAIVPYSQYAFDKFVKWPVDSYASERAARQLAVAAYNECIAAKVNSLYAVGVGCACSLAKDDERKGRVHKVHVAIHKRNSTHVFNGEFDQGYSRQQEEYYVAELLLHALNTTTVDARYTVAPKFDRFSYRNADGRDYAELLENTPNRILVAGNYDDEKPLVVYPGSWNPLHDAHKRIAAIAERALGAPVVFELSINNADKGQIDAIEIGDRIAQVVDFKHAIAITNAPTFVQKAEKFRNQFNGNEIVFVVGYDTWDRIWDPKYAGPICNVDALFNNNGIKFLVVGRKPDPLFLPDVGGLRIVCEEADNFKSEIRGANLRKQQHGN